jgi:uncharacterized protein involved in exopolysaccharide biosynthesis
MNNEEKQEITKDSFAEFILTATPYVKLFIDNWKKLLYVNGAVAVISAAVLLLVIKNYYDATVVIMPDYGANRMLGGLSDLAAVAGFNVGQTPTSLIYQNLLYSESVLEPVINKKYLTEKFPQPVNLIEYYEIELSKTGESDPVPLQRRDKFLQMVDRFSKGIMKSDIDLKSNILTVTIRTKERELSSNIVNTLVASLDQYIRTKRKSNATEQRVYVEKRSDQVKDSLQIVEDALKKFREQNRIVSLSPQLLLEQARLLRNVEILQTVYIELIKQLEIIKLEEVKDVPVINIREYAGVPIQKAGPFRAAYFIVIVLLTIILSYCWLIFRERIVGYYNLLHLK